MKKKSLIGLIVVLVLFTGILLINYFTVPIDDRGFIIALALPMYLVVLLLYAGVVGAVDFIRKALKKN